MTSGFSEANLASTNPLKTIPMKTKFINRIALAAGLFFLSFGQQAKAQVNCPYTIVNFMNCNVDVSWTSYDSNCLPCFTSPVITLVPGSAYTIPCADFCFLPACDLDINVVAVNGVPVTACTVNSTVPSVVIPGTPCSGSDNVNWTPNQTNIQP